MRPAILRTLILASVGLVSTTALAKKPKIHKLDSGTAQLDGAVDVPLYEIPGYEGLPVVAAQVGEQRLFLALAPSLSHSGLYGATAASL
jgi:hypothetical protein